MSIKYIYIYLSDCLPGSELNLFSLKTNPDMVMVSDLESESEKTVLAVGLRQ